MHADLIVSLYQPLYKGGRGSSVKGIRCHVKHIFLTLLHPTQPQEPSYALYVTLLGSSTRQAQPGHEQCVKVEACMH